LPARTAGSAVFGFRHEVKLFENILFAFGCLSIPVLAWWQPETAPFLQDVTGITAKIGVPFRWLIPCLAFSLSGFFYCLDNARVAGRGTQDRTACTALIFGSLSLMLSIPVLPSFLWAVLLGIIYLIAGRLNFH
jgi:hypothetical protein